MSTKKRETLFRFYQPVVRQEHPAHRSTHDFSHPLGTPLRAERAEMSRASPRSSDVPAGRTYGHRPPFASSPGLLAHHEHPPLPPPALPPRLEFMAAHRKYLQALEAAVRKTGVGGAARTEAAKATFGRSKSFEGSRARRRAQTATMTPRRASRSRCHSDAVAGGPALLPGWSYPVGGAYLAPGGASILFYEEPPALAGVFSPPASSPPEAFV